MDFECNLGGDGLCTQKKEGVSKRWGRFWIISSCTDLDFEGPQNYTRQPLLENHSGSEPLLPVGAPYSSRMLRRGKGCKPLSGA